MQGELKRQARRTFLRLRNPIRPDETRRALAALLGDGVDLLFVRSSLSPLGRFTAGLEDVLAALRGFSGMLGLPTHSYCYPERPGEPAPVFDPASTPSQSGLLTEAFRGLSGVRRSVHSTPSLALACSLQPLVAGHADCDTPCGGSAWCGAPLNAASVAAGGSDLMRLGLGAPSPN